LQSVLPFLTHNYASKKLDFGAVVLQRFASLLWQTKVNVSKANKNSRAGAGTFFGLRAEIG